MGWDHMFSEASEERFAFRGRVGPLCPSECSKMDLCGHSEKEERVIGKGSPRVFDVCGTKVIHPMNHLCLVFSMECSVTHTPSHVSSEVYTFTSTWSCMSNVRSSCPPYTVQPYRKSLRKSFVVHLFERWTVRCSLLVLKMCSSGVADTHKSWSS